LLRQKKSSKRKGDFFAIAPRQKKGSTLLSQFANRLGGAGFLAIAYIYLAIVSVFRHGVFFLANQPHLRPKKAPS
jgi:hypothetical protein